MGREMTFMGPSDEELRGRVLIVCCTPDYCSTYSLEPGDEVPEAEQSAFWEDAGTFYAMGGEVRAGPSWVRILNPDNPEARMIAEQFGRPVTLAFVRPSLAAWN
jgi:hypothetical protein